MHLKFALRRWQRQALVRWRNSGSKGIVKVVTGAGKTVFAEACILDFLKRYPTGCVLIIVPTVALADQWTVCLQEELSCTPAEIGYFAGTKKSKPSIVNVMVINTARRKEEYLPATGPWFVIVDECHRAASTKNRKALSGKFEAALGLSATPEREYDEGFSEVLVPLIGDLIYEYGLWEARDDGIVAPFELVNVRVDMLGDELQQYQRLSKAIGIKKRQLLKTEKEDVRFAIEALLRARARVSARATARIPATIKLIERHRNCQVMVFHEDIRSAGEIARLAKERGHSVAVYHTRIGPLIRQSNLRLYRQRVYSVLVSCRALDEGVNLPETQAAVIASATASTRQRLQRLGRVLRPAKNKAEAVVYSIYATDVEEERLLAEAKSLDEMVRVTWLRIGGVRAN